MSESWKNRLWSLLLVCTFAVVLSVCNKALDSSSNGSSSSGTAFADGSTVTISSQALPTISGVMNCKDVGWGTSTYYYSCDASDDTTLSTINSYTSAITHDDAFNAGWRLVGSSCSYGLGAAASAQRCFLFHK